MSFGSHDRSATFVLIRIYLNSSILTAVVCKIVLHGKYMKITVSSCKLIEHSTMYLLWVGTMYLLWEVTRCCPSRIVFEKIGVETTKKNVFGHF